MKNESTHKVVLITGGTSGLGKSLAECLADNGYSIVTIGRILKPEKKEHPKIQHIPCDFSDLDQVVSLVDLLTERKAHFDILINNAGILSPPDYQLSKNGFELSYQVNFLAHVLLTQLLYERAIFTTGLVINVSSPIYKKGRLALKNGLAPDNYKLFQVYANTKLYMALYSDYLVQKGISSFSFNPGTFSSDIYRMQKKWFHLLYKIAAPFMISSDKVAERLVNILLNGRWKNGEMMKKSGYLQLSDRYDSVNKEMFWQEVQAQIGRFLK